MKIAALFFFLFKKDDNQKMDDGDVILASTAYLNQGHVLTANQKHFPEPYFKEVKSWDLIFKKDLRTQKQLIYLLKPNFESINIDSKSKFMIPKKEGTMFPG